jgi:hypothetical protein
VIKQRWCGAVLVLLACGGRPAPVEPVHSPTEAVQGFMQAVADSNLAKMATLWGTANGPAAKTHQPQDYERRIVIIQAYLRNQSYRVTSDIPESPNRRSLQVELKRQTCTWNVPFIVVKTRDGSWLVNQIDLTTAGNPARPCLEGRDSARKG